ncbi:MAG: hypothetical protein JWP00_4656 [Chloroflexi bacterium]|nr:hypothetical protein [Chloroflexota bacterium]
MEKQQALLSAVICEAAGLACMLIINRLLPIPFDLIVTGVGFMLLVFGPFLYFLGRDPRY